MDSRFQVAVLVFVLWSVDTQAQVYTNGWEPVPQGMVLTRNAMVPKTPTKDGYQLLPERYHLGSNTYARPAPSWWLKMAGDLGIGDKWHPKDFPLAYAGEFRSTNGTTVLLVVQVSHAFTGDGFYSRGPELYLVARLIRPSAAGNKLIKEDSFNIGNRQLFPLFAGEANGRSIVFRLDRDGGPHGETTPRLGNLTLSLGDDDSLSIK